jgi:hypothetical protein
MKTSEMKIIGIAVLFVIIAPGASAQCSYPYFAGVQCYDCKLTSSQVVQIISSPLVATDTCRQYVWPLGTCSLLIFNKACEPVGQYETYSLFSPEQRKQIIAKIAPGVKLFFDRIQMQQRRLLLPPVTIVVK